MKRLIALDIDGTTLHSDHTISRNTVDLLKSLTHYDVEWLFATGRSFEMVQPILDKYNLTCDLILNNGHEYLSVDKRTHHYHPMSFEVFTFIIEILIKYDFHISIHTTNGKYILTDYDTYFNQHLSIGRAHDEINKTEASDSPVFNKDLFLANTHVITSYLQLEDIPVLKIDSKISDPLNMEKALAELESRLDLEISSSYGQFLEVCQNDYDKGKTLLEVAILKGIDQDQVFVFGDGLNDLGMFIRFKNSFAPCNAKEVVLNRAAHIIPTADDDGVYNAIQTLLETDFLVNK